MRRGVVVAMLATALAALAVGAAFSVAGCDMPSTGGLGQVGGSGVVVPQHYDYSGFTKVVVESGFDVVIDYADDDTYAVAVTVDDNLVEDHLKVELDGDTLHIGLEPLWNYHDVTTRARVVLPRLTGVEASGSSSVVVTTSRSGAAAELEASGSSTVEFVGAVFGDVAVDVSGASWIQGSAELGELAGEVSGGSSLDLTGSASRLRLDVSGGSRLDLLDLRVVDADLDLSGGSNGRVTVTGRLTVDASGGSRLEYAGHPQVGVDTSGGSAVEPY